jgi:hypothetical protein
VVVGLAALASTPDSGCESGTTTQQSTGADDDFSFAPGAESGSGSGGGDLPTCDDVVVLSSASGPMDLPGDDPLFDEASVVCEMAEDHGDGDAVAALQDALARCNGQPVAVDGDYGPDTTRAVTAVQRQHGLTVDGAYGPQTGQAMRWPASSAAGDTCATAVVAPG